MALEVEARRDVDKQLGLAGWHSGIEGDDIPDGWQ